MSNLPRPPQSYERFIARFPKAGQAWDLLARAGEEAGPLEQKVRLLVKLGIAIGSLREGPVHSAVRKAQAAGITREELEQVVALAAPTIGLPSTVAAHGWVLEQIERTG